MLESWTTGTASLAFLLYLISISKRLNLPPGEESAVVDGTDAAALPCKPVWPLILETAAWMVLVVHVGSAFAEHHQWSHRAAEEQTAMRTEQVLGVRWGGGIYFNYALLVLWGLGLWRGWIRLGATPGIRTWVDGAIDGYTGFMWWNAMVTFGSHDFRVVGLMGFVILGIQSLLLVQQRRGGFAPRSGTP